MYESLTEFIGRFSNPGSMGDMKGEGSVEHPLVLPGFHPSVELENFIKAFYALEGFADHDYFETLGRDADDVERIDIESAELPVIRAALTFCIRADRMSPGALASFCEDGFIDRLLTRLMELDEGDR